MTQPDPVKSIDIIGRIAIDEIKRMWAGVEEEFNTLRLDKDKLIDAIEAATGEQAEMISGFKTRMASITSSITALHSNVVTNEPTGDDGKPIPAFLTQRLSPPPDRASIVSTLGDVIGVNGKKDRKPPQQSGGGDPDQNAD